MSVPGPSEYATSGGIQPEALRLQQEAYASSRFAQEAAEQAANTHKAHRRKGLSVSQTWANCDNLGLGTCGREKIMYLCSFSEADHRGRNGRRLAALYEITGI